MTDEVIKPMTPLTRAQIEAIGTRETRNWVKWKLTDQMEFVPLTVAERDALCMMARWYLVYERHLQESSELEKENAALRGEVQYHRDKAERKRASAAMLTAGLIREDA